MHDKTDLHTAPAAKFTDFCNPPRMLRNKILLCLLLAILTLGIYRQTGSNGFINLDDNLYMTENVQVQKGLAAESIGWAFTTFHAGNWHPLTWLSHMADIELFGLNPRGHHLTSAVIHTASACLLFLFLANCTLKPWRSFFVAALFALHPLHVESVAWVAERKDLLCCFFWMLTLLIYSGYAKRPSLSRYLLTIFSFVLALTAKPMAVTLPLILLLMDYWPCASFHRQRQPAGLKCLHRRLLIEKTPFLFLSLVAGVVTIFAQQKSSYMAPFDILPFGLRVENALVAYASYMGKMVRPHDLAIIYPYSRSLSLWHSGGSLLLLTGISIPAYRSRKQLPYLLMGWLWFLITLLPVIGLIQVGSQSMADRYTYIPLTGLFILATWGVSDLTEKWRHGKGLLAFAATVILLALAAVTTRQISYWKDSGSVLEHAVEVTSGNYIAHNNLGMHLRRQGRNREALHHFLRSVDISHNYSTAHFNLGVTFTALGNRVAALHHIRTALLIDPADPDARLYLEFLTAAAHPDQNRR